MLLFFGGGGGYLLDGYIYSPFTFFVLVYSACTTLMFSHSIGGMAKQRWLVPTASTFQHFTQFFYNSLWSNYECTSMQLH